MGKLLLLHVIITYNQQLFHRKLHQLMYHSRPLTIPINPILGISIQKTVFQLRLVVLKARPQDQQHQHYPGICQKFQIPTPALFDLRFWGWDQFLPSPSNDSEPLVQILSCHKAVAMRIQVKCVSYAKMFPPIHLKS